MLSKSEFKKIRNSLNQAENRSGLMKSLGFSPSYSLFLQFLAGYKDSFSGSKVEIMLDNLDYEAITIIVPKKNKEESDSLNKIKEDNFENFRSFLIEHSQQFKFKPKKISKRLKGDTNFILNALKNSVSEKETTEKEYSDRNEKFLDNEIKSSYNEKFKIMD